ncbi:hypothetical protein B0F90DRAFT_1820227 [Multifurca ochricompacta]|uniref:Uncharacterized protein n=1 Tax=Multifurca ochricompacta TaxID=376703 RepID=A0AAD4LYW4_9AGAM|nr:hypothetical protein B0F90DRAFT_1820227 [Multifurca ochricompacta]
MSADMAKEMVDVGVVEPVNNVYTDLDKTVSCGILSVTSSVAYYPLRWLKRGSLSPRKKLFRFDLPDTEMAKSESSAGQGFPMGVHSCASSSDFTYLSDSHSSLKGWDEAKGVDKFAAMEEGAEHPVMTKPNMEPSLDEAVLSRLNPVLGESTQALGTGAPTGWTYRQVFETIALPPIEAPQLYRHALESTGEEIVAFVMQSKVDSGHRIQSVYTSHLERERAPSAVLAEETTVSGTSATLKAYSSKKAGRFARRETLKRHLLFPKHAACKEAVLKMLGLESIPVFGLSWMTPFCDGPDRPWESPGFELTDLKTVKEKKMRLSDSNNKPYPDLPGSRRRYE